MAAIPLVIGVFYALTESAHYANRALERHERVTCAHEVYKSDRKRFWRGVFDPENKESTLLDAQKMGCSSEPEPILISEATQPPPDFNWWATYGEIAGPVLIIAAFVAAAIYGLLRGIGWVIGGFAT